MCHCILNVNSKIMGLALYAGAFERVVKKYLAAGIGMIQLPCPELTYLGLKRWGMTRDQYDTPYYRRHCTTILTPYVDQIVDYTRNGYQVEAVIGVDGSPSCGVHRTCIGYRGGMIGGEPSPQFEELQEPGVFIRTLAEMLNAQGLSIPMEAIREDDPV